MTNCLNGNKLIEHRNECEKEWDTIASCFLP